VYLSIKIKGIETKIVKLIHISAIFNNCCAVTKIIKPVSVVFAILNSYCAVNYIALLVSCRQHNCAVHGQTQY
jgi:hypothetical protein